MRPRLTFKIMNGLVAIDRLLATALVRLPGKEAQGEIAVARRWIAQMSAWWDEGHTDPVPPEAR